MGDRVYKVDKSIKVIFQALGGQTGITDLEMVVYDPDDNASTPVVMDELSNGLYEKEFIPDETGRWYVEVTSTAYPENGSKVSYLVNISEGAVVIVPPITPNIGYSAFDLLKVANESLLIGYRWTQGVIDEEFTKDITGSGSLGIIEQNGLQLNSGASTSSGIEFTSNNIYRYKPGLGQLVKMSIVLGDSGVAGNIREWGLFDDTDGVFIRLNETQYEFVIRSNSVETVVPASNWDVPVTPNANGHLWYIQFQWLGVGDFNLYYDGQVVYTHNFLGTSQFASMENPDLTIRLTNTNTTNNTDIILKNYCIGIYTEGNTVISGLDDNNVIREVRVNESGRLLTSQEPPSAPPATTAVNEGGQVTVLKQGDTNEFNWVIPNGENFILQRFEAGGYVPKDGNYLMQSKLELWYQPNGTSAGQELVTVIYLQHMSDNFRDLNRTFIGDGTGRMQIKITNWAVEDAEFTRIFRGYY